VAEIPSAAVLKSRQGGPSYADYRLKGDILFFRILGTERGN